MDKLDCFKAKARDLARSGYFYGLPPLEFELSFEEGFDEAREWLDQPSWPSPSRRAPRRQWRLIEPCCRMTVSVNSATLYADFCCGSVADVKAPALSFARQT